MAGDPKARSELDRTTINVSEPTEVRFWTRELDVGADTLLGAVKKVGPDAQVVRKFLRGPSHPEAADSINVRRFD
jgi:Protein of unknown function (DUF3606)